MRILKLAFCSMILSGCGGDNEPAKFQNEAGTSGSGGEQAAGGAGSMGASSSMGGSKPTAGSSWSLGGKNDSTEGGAATTGSGAINCGPGVTPDALTTTEFTDVSPTEGGLERSGDEKVFTQGIATDPSNPGTVYVTISGYNDKTHAVIPGGICRSTDFGNTWEPVGKLEQPLAIRVNPKNPMHMYAGDGVRGGTQGFWVTTDGGETWTSPKGFQQVADALHSSDVYHVEPDPEDFNHVLVSFHGVWNMGQDFGFGAGTAGVIESLDGGANWTVHNPAPGWAGAAGYAVFILYSPELGIGDSKTWLVGSQGAGYWRTTDGGQSWKQVTKVSMSHGGAQVYRAANGDLYLGGDLTPIMSTDNGATWTPLTNDDHGVPLGYYFSLYGDGTRMYTSSNGTDNKFISALESDPTSWAPFGTAKFTASTFEMALDKEGGVLYSSAWGAGVLAVKTAP